MVGRVVGTGLDTAVMPMVRYVTDDLAMWADRPCSCGRAATLVRDFVGRPREAVVSRSGALVPFLAVYTGPGHRDLRAKIRELQFVQERRGELVVRLAPAEGVSGEDVKREYLAQLRRRLSPEEFDIRIDIVEYVPRSGRGKLGMLVQRLPIEFGDIPAHELKMPELHVEGEAD